MVRSIHPWVVLLPDGTLNIEIEVDRATVSALMNILLNLVVLPSEALHTLQASVLMEL